MWAIGALIGGPAGGVAWLLAMGLCRTPAGRDRLTGSRVWLLGVLIGALVGQILVRLPLDGQQLVGYAVFSTVLLAAAFVDYAEMRLPDVLTLPLIAAAVLLLPWLTPGDGWDHARPILAAVAAGAWALFVAILADQSLGDVKLAAGIGGWLAWHSWTALAASVVVGQILVAVVIGSRALHRRGAGLDPADTPIGPVLAVGAVAGLMVGII